MRKQAQDELAGATGADALPPGASAVGLPPLSPQCRGCKVRDLAVCSALGDHEMGQLSDGISNPTYVAGQSVFQEGAPAEALFSITSGALKSFKLLPDGRRQITGFLFPGDLAGLAQNGCYTYSAESIGTTRCCRFLRTRFDQLRGRFPNLEKRLLENAVDELAEARNHMLLLGRKTATERVASFLLHLSRRQAARGLPPGASPAGRAAQPVELPMSRADIADHLGLTTETVSRSFTQLDTDGLIRRLPGGWVALIDQRRLGELAGGSA